MKKATILTLLIAFTAISSFAQKATSKPAQVMSTADESALRATEKLKTQLQLTPDQYQKILAINKNFYTQSSTIKTTPETEASKIKMKAMNQVKEDEIVSVLTPEQRAKLSGK